MQSIQENQLVDKAKAGDSQAFSLLYRLYINRIFAFCLVRIRAKLDAEDVTEKVFIKALRAIKDFRQDSSFATWIYAIARNEIKDFYRQRHDINLPIYLLESLEDKHNVDDAGLINQTKQRVNRILSKLIEKDQTILKLRFIQGLGNKDAADMLGISEANAKIRTYRAIRNAKAIADKEEYE